MKAKIILHAAAWLLLAVVAGCGGHQQQGPSWWAGGYDAIVAGQTTGSTLTSQMPADSIHTSTGLAHFSRSDWNGEEQAIVVMVDPAGMTVAKFRVKAKREQTLMGVSRSAEVQAEFTGKITPTAPPGDFAQITTAMENLRKAQTHPLAKEAHNLVSAGLLRVLEQLPGVPMPAGDVQRLSVTLDKIPSGGEITLAVVRPAAYRITYTVSQMTNK